MALKNEGNFILFSFSSCHLFAFFPFFSSSYFTAYDGIFSLYEGNGRQKKEEKVIFDDVTRLSRDGDNDCALK